MGAGFIGCIILEALAKRCVKLTVVGKEAGMVPQMMNSMAGALIKQGCQQKGITVHTSVEIMAIEETQNGRRFNVVLEDGHVWKDKLKADPTRIMEAYIANTHALGFNGDRFNAEFYYENKA
jgi:pyruvate/2-oxoglutarate dehydrogenase complex dihydrolipoamide dehydrogenase (E3) component